MIIVRKLNESFYELESDFETTKAIFDFLKVEEPNAKYDPRVQAGIYDGFKRFATVRDRKLIIPSGLMFLLKRFDIFVDENNYDFTDEQVDDYFENILKILPFAPRDYQELSFRDSVKKNLQFNQMCTSSGKSMTISLLADFFTKNGKKGVLIVPNISLLSQFHNDIKSYNLLDLYNSTHLIGGENKIKHLDSNFTITTWQSMGNMDKKEFAQIDFVMIDEAQILRANIASEITRHCVNAVRYGFTGTVPDGKIDAMALFGVIGPPKVYIRAGELIKYGLGTPLEINTIKLEYNKEFLLEFRKKKVYSDRLKMIKEYQPRTNFIARLAEKVSKKGNTLILFQHTDHGKEIFKTIYYNRYGEHVENKNITGKKAFEFQSKCKIYFVNGEVEGKVREEIRQILEHDTEANIVANFAVMSTGTNIKNLHNMIFASPLKAYITITQAIGRGMRLHDSKDIFKVYDIADQLTPFSGQYKERKKKSYDREAHPVIEATFKI